MSGWIVAAGVAASLGLAWWGSTAGERGGRMAVWGGIASAALLVRFVGPEWLRHMLEPRFSVGYLLTLVAFFAVAAVIAFPIGVLRARARR